MDPITSSSIDKSIFKGNSNENATQAREWITQQLHGLAMGQQPPGNFRQMLYLESPPGYGKTTFIKSLVRDLNATDPLLKDRIAFIETVLAAHESPSDIMGTAFPITMPIDETGYNAANSVRGVVGVGDQALPVRHVVQTWTPILRQIERAIADGKIILWFFDELNNINPQWEASLLKLNEGRLKQRVLPNEILLVGAGNPPEQSIHKSGFGESLKARLYRIPFIPDYAQWREYMLADGQDPENLVMRIVVADFIEANRNYFLESVKGTPEQLGYIATSPRSWTLTADGLARLYRHNVTPPTIDQVKWLVKRRIPASIASEFTNFFSSYPIQHLLDARRQSSLSAGTTAESRPLRQLLVSIPAVSPNYHFHLPPIPAPMPSAGNNQGEEWNRDRNAKASLIQQEIERKVQTCINEYFSNDIEQHDFIYNNLLSYLMDSLHQASSFRPIPFLVAKPGVGKTSFVSEIVTAANRLVDESRQKFLESGGQASPEVMKKFKNFVLLEVVLPSIPNVSDLTGLVLPLVMDDPSQAKGEDGESSLPANANQLRIRLHGDDDLPKRHSVTAWTWFTRTVDKLAREGKQVVIFLDELSNISPEWEAVFLKMVEGKVGTWEMPPSVVFLTAGNFSHQSAFARTFKEPMQARLEFMEYVPHFGKWVAHMLRPNVSKNDYLARFAVVNFLCENPSSFNTKDVTIGSEPSLCVSVSPRDWTLGANWIRRISDWLQRSLTQEELVYYLAPRLSSPIATKFSEAFTSDEFTKSLHEAQFLWESHQIGRQLLVRVSDDEIDRSSSTSHLKNPDGQMQSKRNADMKSLQDLRAHSEQVAAKISQIREGLLRKRDKGNKNEEIMQNDIEEHLRMTVAVKSYLLETPPPEGEFCDFIYLESPPGYGKTSYLKGIIDEINHDIGQEKYQLIEINLASLTPPEVIGIPFPVFLDKDNEPIELPDSGIRSPGDEMLPRRHVVNSWTSFFRELHNCLQEGKTPVLLLDEMSNISPQWEAILLKLSEAKIGNNWQIKGPIRFIGAGNPPEDSRAGRHFKAAFNARLYRLPFRPNFLDYVGREKSAPPSVFYEFAAETIVNYLTLYPDQFVPPPGKLNSQNRLLCPRNWTIATNCYSMLLQSEAKRLQLPEDTLKSGDALRGLTVNQEKLRNWLLPVLPPDTVKSLTSFVSLNCIITGDEIITEGKSVPPDLTSEQVKIILHSATTSLVRHVIQAEKDAGIVQNDLKIRVYSTKSAKEIAANMEKDEKLAAALIKYTGNFVNFIDDIGANPSVNQKLDSLMMPNLDNLVTALKALHRFTNLTANNFQPKENHPDYASALMDVSRRIMHLYECVYNSIYQDDISHLLQSSSQTASGPSPTGASPTSMTSPFLMAGNPPRHQFSGGGIS